MSILAISKKSAILYILSYYYSIHSILFCTFTVSQFSVLTLIIFLNSQKPEKQDRFDISVLMIFPWHLGSYIFIILKSEELWFGWCSTLVRSVWVKICFRRTWHTIMTLRHDTVVQRANFEAHFVLKKFKI